MLGGEIVPKTMGVNIKMCGPKRKKSRFTDASVDEILSYFKDREFIEVDTETEGLDVFNDKIVTLQLGDSFTQYVIDVRTIDILQFKELLESTTCIIHNAKFDYKVLYLNGITLNKVYDTMIAELVIFNGYEKERGISLDKVLKNYLGVTLLDNVSTTYNMLRGAPLRDNQIQYAGMDVAYLTRVKNTQFRLIEMYDLHNAIEMAMKVIFSLADMELEGMYLDKKDWGKVAIKNKLDLHDITLELDKYLIDEEIERPYRQSNDLFGNPNRTLSINYKSPVQVKNLLLKSGTDVEDTSDGTLSKIKGNKIVDLLLKYRKTAKKVSTYGDNFLNYINTATGRVHTDFWQIQSTYRLGSGSKKVNAPNIQNIPAINVYRNCFKARDGYKWVSFDYSSQELRIIADKTGEHKFIDALNNNEDLHCYAYNLMTGETITKQDKAKRDKAKTINFGKPFGMSPYKLADRLDIPIEEAKEIFELYEKALPDLNKGLEKQAEFGLANGYILTDKRHKGRRWFPEVREIKNNPNLSWKEKNKLKGSVTRACYNTPIQGTAAVQIKQAMIDIRDWAIKEGYWRKEVILVCQVHDELNFEIKEDYVEKLTPIIRKLMVDAANMYLELIKMEADEIITDYWTKE